MDSISCFQWVQIVLSTASIISSIVAICLMIWTVCVMRKNHTETTDLMKQDYSERIKEREIKAKETMIHGLLSRYYSNLRLEYHQEQIWKNLNDLYKETEKAAKKGEKHKFLELLNKWEHIKNIHCLYDIDSQIREYYKIEQATKPSI